MNCSSCHPGYFQNSSGQISCNACPIGTFLGTNAGIACLPCDVNTYQPNINGTQCLPCPTGFFQNLMGQISCLALSTTTTVTPAYLRSRIAAFSKDLDAQAGSELRVQTIGSAPNRICVIQWKNYRKYSSGNNLGDNLNFQIRLKETSNLVEVVYGAFTNNTNTAYAQVGLGGSSNTDFNNRKTTTNWASTTAGTADTRHTF